MFSLDHIILHFLYTFIFSLFTVELREHDSMYKKLSLVFTQIAKRDTGFYRCVARNPRRMSADWKVELIVVGKISKHLYVL